MDADLWDLFLGTGIGVGSLKEEFYLQRGCLLAVFQRGGWGESAGIEFYDVASEDTTILSKQKSPSYRLPLVSAPRIPSDSCGGDSP